MSFLLENLDLALFYFFTVIALGSALYMILQRNPTYGAFSFILTLCSLSAIYGLLGSSFIAVLQIVVYAGAIMVLFLFVLMLLNVKAESHAADNGAMSAIAAVLAIAFLALLAGVLARADFVTGAAPTFDASAQKVARELFSPRFLYVFEATSVLILAALVGSILLAKKEK